MADLKAGTTVGGNTIWTQANLPLLPTGDTVTFKGFKVYTENDKPTKAEIGLGNVTNDAQVKKSGDTMTGDLTLTNNRTLTVPRRFVLQSDAAATNPYMVATRFDNNAIVDGFPAAETTSFDLAVKTKSNTTDPNSGAYLFLQRVTQKPTGEGSVMFRVYGTPNVTTGASGPASATIHMGADTGVTTLSGNGLTVTMPITATNMITSTQLDIKGTGNRNLFFRDNSGNELALLYVDSAKNAFIRTGGSFVTRFSSDGSVLLANNLTVPGTLSVTGTTTAARINASGSIRTTGDNTSIIVGNNGDLGFVKKGGAASAIGVGLNTLFRIARSNVAGVISPADTYTDVLTIGSGLNGAVTARGEIISTFANGFRLAQGNFGFFIRNDQSNTYFMLTDSGDAYGGYNSLRPLAVNNTTGLVSIGNGLTVSNGITFNPNSAAIYDLTSLSTGTSGSKSYLRTFRGGNGDTIWHETVQNQLYRLATGNTDTTEALSVTSNGDFSTNTVTAQNGRLATRDNGNSHVWFETANGTEKAVIYASADKRFHIRANGFNWEIGNGGMILSQNAVVGEDRGLIRGEVEGGGHGQWRNRAAGLQVDCPNIHVSAYNIWRATKWGSAHAAAMDVHMLNDVPANTVVRLIVATDATFNFQGNGDLYVNNGNVNANDVYIRSDIRLKRNLVQLDSALSKVELLTGYYYEKKRNIDAEEYTEHEVGLIAQDVQKVLPQAVNEDKDTSILTISPSAINALLVEAIKELTAQNKDLANRLGTLEAKYNQC